MIELDSFQQWVLGYLIGLCIIGFFILWTVLDIRNKLNSEDEDGKN